MGHWAQYDSAMGRRYVASEDRAGVLAWSRAFHLRHLGPAEGKRVLDLACGAGDDLGAYRAAGAEAIGMDGSAYMLSHARARANRLVRGDVSALPFQDASFDAVVSAFGIQYADDLAAAFAEARRILKPRGLLAATVSHPEDPRPEHAPDGRGRMMTIAALKRGVTITYPAHTLLDHRRALAGFSIVEAESYLDDGLPRALAIAALKR